MFVNKFVNCFESILFYEIAILAIKIQFDCEEYDVIISKFTVQLNIFNEHYIILKGHIHHNYF